MFVVDNASGDDTPEMVRRFDDEHANVHAILNEGNHGLAYANNQPLGRLAGDLVLILNPDTILGEGTVASLVQ